MRRRLWPVVVAAVLGCAILAGLGLWQVERLQWKQGLLAELDRRAAADPVSLGTALERDPQDIDYLKVSASGGYTAAPELKLIASHEGGPAWHLLQPFLGEDGVAILVDRGIVPHDVPADARRPAPPGRTTVTGVLVRHATRPGIFTPGHDRANNIWYAWDLPTMLEAAALPPEARVAPFILHATDAGEGYPTPTPLKANLRNNHLGYAITWFGLAIVLVVMATMFIRQQLRRGGA